MKAHQWQNLAATLVLILSLLQTVGDLTGSRVLKGIGAASAASPLPKVFCESRGFEPFASTFLLRAETPNGEVIERQITPELYQHLTGPYNRRNAYGAALAYAPRLPRPLWEAVANYGLRPGGPLRRELALPTDMLRVTILISTQTRGRGDRWLLDPSCTN
jgi:hypothetical protein